MVDAPDDLGEGQFALAGHHGVDVGEVRHQRPAHWTLAVGPAEHHDRVRARLLDPPGERQRGNLLMEDVGEADDRRPQIEHAVSASSRNPSTAARQASATSRCSVRYSAM